MSEEEEEIPAEEVEEKGEVVEEEETLRGFTIEGLELMLSRVEEIERLIRGNQIPEAWREEKTPKKEVVAEETAIKKTKRSKGGRKKVKQVKSE